MRRAQSEDGQAMILGAGIFAAVFVFLAIVIYLGGGLTQRRTLQNSADAAALAGAQALNGTSDSEGAAIAAARDWAAKNVSALKSTTVTVADNYTTIRVGVTKDSFFAFSAFGLGSAEIRAHAKARIASQSLPGPGVVPIGVELSSYPGNGVFEMKDKNIGAGSSNTGLVDLGDGGDIIRDGLKYGSQTPLQPTLETKTGNTFGQATQNNNSGLIVRIRRAIAHSPQCYDWVQATNFDYNSTGIWACNPFVAKEPDGVQATSVILIPVISEDFTDLNGKKTIHVAPSGQLYILAYFWVDADRTFANPLAGDYSLDPANPKGSIWGRFIDDAPTQLAVYDQNNCGASCGIVDYDPDSIFKVVQLIE